MLEIQFKRRDKFLPEAHAGDPVKEQRQILA
jgi:hypothetical protein